MTPINKKLSDHFSFFKYLQRGFVILFMIFSLISCNSETATEKPASETEEGHNEEEGHKEGAGEEKHEEGAENAVELTARQYEVAGIETGKAALKNLSNVLRVNGILEVPPQNLVSINAPLGGFIKQTNMLQGKRVRKGEVVAIIENPEFIEMQQQYLESSSRLEYLTQEVTRQRELRKENVNAAKTLQQAEAEYKSVRAQVNGLKAKLNLIGVSTKQLNSGRITSAATIVSPINGYVTEVNVNIGKNVTATDALFTIADTDNLHVELTVFEKDAAKIVPGQKVRFTLPNENQERTATVSLVSKAISSDRSVQVHSLLDKKDPNLIPGTFITAQIELKGASVKALPQEAVVQAAGKTYIFLAKGQRKEGEEMMHDFEMLEITTGVAEDNYIEVFLPASVSDTAQIVTKGAYALLSKNKNTEEEGGGHGH